MRKFTVNINISDQDEEGAAKIDLKIDPIPTCETDLENSEALQLLKDFQKILEDRGEATVTKVKATEKSTGNVLYEKEAR